MASTRELQVPNLGESVTEATIARWVKSDGASVEAGDVVAELETDKATVELPAGAAGVLKIGKQEGQTVNVGDVIATIEAGAPAAKTAGAAAPVAASQAASPAAPAAARETEASGPAVQRLLAEHKLDPAQIPASGREGRLTKQDVLAYLEKTNEPVADAAAAAKTQQGQASSAGAAVKAPGTTTVYGTPAAETPEALEAPAPARAAPTAGGADEDGVRVVEMSKLRQTLARRLVEAQHVTASLTTFNEVDMSAVLALREKYKERFEKTHSVGLGFMSFFAKAVVAALAAVPAGNAQIQGNSLVFRKAVHLGIAVSTERGLMVPVVRHAERLTMAQIELEIKRLATRAREGKITVDEMTGGTFTITNGGVFGSLLSTPILNPPQSAILGMHKIEKRPVVITENGVDQIVARPMMYVALTYDHRVIDGQQSVTLLVKVKEALEDPARMLLEI